VNSRNKILAMLPAMVFGIGLAIPAVASDTSTSPPVPASTSMNQAAEDTQGAIENAYVGTVTALQDTTITSEVKAAFFSDVGIKSTDIHVTTTAGVVTLDGQVESPDMAAHVEAIARNMTGVRDVTNDLRVSSSPRQN
jgi:hyperosmotically inducible periplasmic protein